MTAEEDGRAPVGPFVFPPGARRGFSIGITRRQSLVRDVRRSDPRRRRFLCSQLARAKVLSSFAWNSDKITERELRADRKASPAIGRPPLASVSRFSSASPAHDGHLRPHIFCPTLHMARSARKEMPIIANTPLSEDAFPLRSASKRSSRTPCENTRSRGRAFRSVPGFPPGADRASNVSDGRMNEYDLEPDPTLCTEKRSREVGL